MKKIAKKTAKKTSSDSKGAAKKSRMTPAKKGAASNLSELFEDALKDIYWAEKALTKALPKMEKNATSPELKSAITDHLAATQEQVSRLEEVFQLIGKKAVAKKCEAMQGLIEEGEGVIEDTEPGSVRDAGIISAAQKVEHYEIATYGTLKYIANILGMSEAAGLLEATLNEEKEADELLTSVASDINHAADQLA